MGRVAALFVGSVCQSLRKYNWPHFSLSPSNRTDECLSYTRELLESFALDSHTAYNLPPIRLEFANLLSAMSGIGADESSTTPLQEALTLLSISPTSNNRHVKAGHHNHEDAGDQALPQAVAAVTATTLPTPESQTPGDTEDMIAPGVAANAAGSGAQVAAKYLEIEKCHPERVERLIAAYLVSNSDEYSKLSKLRELVSVEYP